VLQRIRNNEDVAGRGGEAVRGGGVPGHGAHQTALQEAAAVRVAARARAAQLRGRPQAHQAMAHRVGGSPARLRHQLRKQRAPQNDGLLSPLRFR
jgi:hypothetical protein